MNKKLLSLMLALFITGCGTNQPTSSRPEASTSREASSQSSTSKNESSNDSGFSAGESSNESQYESSGDDISSTSDSDPSSSASSPSSSASSSSSSSSSGTPTSSSSSSSTSYGPDPVLGDTYLVLDDNMPYYYVGETFKQIYDIGVTMVEKGKAVDITNRTSSFNIDIKDSNGNAIDPDKPFKTAGKYSLTIYMVGKKTGAKVSSAPLEITVKDTPTKVISNRTAVNRDLNYGAFENSCLTNLSYPDRGDINALVIPIQISDFPFNQSEYGDNYYERIEAAFCGNGVEDTGYWESVSSYYKKSSFNQLNINFDIAETYISPYSSDDVMNVWSTEVVLSALRNYKNAHGASSLKKYDNDGDGYIDGLWAVYSAPDYGSHFYNSFANNVFWAYCTDHTGESANIEEPTLHSYGWASISFLTGGVEAPKVDTHTFIHETGHLFGLPDYYSYDKNGAIASGSQGGLAMMDLNIGDHDSFSKLSLGWADPYVATEDSIVTLKSNTLTGDCLLLADHWNGTAFDEYILVDFVTQDGLNALDSSEVYEDKRLYYSKPGVRIYHIDARLGEFKYCYPGENGAEYEGIFPIANNNNYYVEDNAIDNIINLGYVPRAETSPLKSLNERGSGFIVINANSSTRNMIEDTTYNSNRLITLVSPDGTNYEIKDAYANNDSLFHNGQSWSLNQNSLSYFNNADRLLNNGNRLGWSISVLSMDNDEVTILVKKY